MNGKWLVSGVGRSGTSSVYKSLLQVARRCDPNFSFFYEPYLWGESIWDRRPENWAANFSVTSAINPVGLSAHLLTPLFLSDAQHAAHDKFSDEIFNVNENVLAKIIRGSGRLEYFLNRYPDLSIVYIIRNPLDCVNSALGLFSFFGDEFHPTDKIRFFEHFPEISRDSLSDAAMFGMWWQKMNDAALVVAAKYPERVFVLPYEQYLTNSNEAFSKLLEFLGAPKEYVNDIVFSAPAGPITTEINLFSNDIADLMGMHGEYFERLPEYWNGSNIGDALGFKAMIEEKYSNPKEGTFSPDVPWEMSPLVVRRRYANVRNRFSQQMARKTEQVDRLRSKIVKLHEKLGQKNDQIEQQQIGFEQQRNAIEEQREQVRATKLDHLNLEIKLQKLEQELKLLHDRFGKSEADKRAVSARLQELEYVLAPRLKTVLTLRPLRFVLAQRMKLTSKNSIEKVEESSAIQKLEATDLHFDRLDNASIADQLELKQSTSHIQSIYEKHVIRKPLGIALFAYDRADHIGQVLKSLDYQDALRDTVVWIDGDQGNTRKKLEIDKVEQVVRQFSVKSIRRNRSNFGFRKVMLLAMREMMSDYDRILFLEDDCFPTRHSLAGFSYELDTIENDENVFSVYGHPFSIENEVDGHFRFQGWGWATTKEKLAPIWKQLSDCYMMAEDQYLEFTNRALTDELREKIDVTPGRQPSDTLTKFFAWDETLCLLTAMRGQRHKLTTERLIFNFGAGDQSTHFTNVDYYRKPPFNMISIQEIWKYF